MTLRLFDPPCCSTGVCGSDVTPEIAPDRRDNFDIYLPLWLARYNKLIFGWLFVAGLLFTLACRQGWIG